MSLPLPTYTMVRDLFMFWYGTILNFKFCLRLPKVFNEIAFSIPSVKKSVNFLRKVEFLLYKMIFVRSKYFSCLTCGTCVFKMLLHRRVKQIFDYIRVMFT